MIGEKCELCGSGRQVQKHHIVPRVLQDFGLDFDCEENLINVCKKCHALLTPSSFLTKIGQRKKTSIGNLTYQFYKRLNDLTKEGVWLSGELVMDVYDEVYGVEKGEE